MKQFTPNDATDEGIVMVVKLLQLSKQFQLIDVTDEGIVIEDKLLQCAKQYRLNDVTDEGIEMEVKTDTIIEAIIPQRHDRGG